MRITIAIGPYFPVPPLLGGAVERAQLGLAEEFATRGHDVTIISRLYGPLAEAEVQHGVKQIRVPSWDAPKSRLLFRLYDYLYARHVAEALPQSEITVTNSIFLPLVLPRAKAGALYVHAERFPKGQVWLWLRGDRIQTVSETVAQAVRRQAPGLGPPVTVIPNPLWGPLGFVASPDCIRSRPRTILYVGRLAEEKGVHLLVEAFARVAHERLAGYRLRIVGPHLPEHGGSGIAYLQRLRASAARARGAVEFAGPMFDEIALRQVYEEADIFVYPSVAARGEASPLAPLEAMAAGCRVVVSALRCFDEYVEPDINALVFDHCRDPVSTLADTLVRMTALPPLPMRRAAVATAARFEIGTIADRYLADFEAVLAERAAR